MTLAVPGLDQAPTTHADLLEWVREVAALTTPDRVYWCDGSDDEWRELTTHLVAAGTLVRLAKKPNSFWAASDPSDVARVEDRTFICSEREEDAGPTNNWMNPAEMKATMTELTGVRCGAAPCSCCRSAWARWTTRTRNSGWRSPTPPTSRSPCA